MKLKNVLSISFLIITTILNAQDFRWGKSFGGSSYDEGRAIKVDASGNVYTTGTFLGTVDFDPGVGVVNLTSTGGGDVFVQKMDALGNFLWAKSFGGTGYDFVESITVDAQGNVYTTGSFIGTVDFDPGVGTVNITSTGGDDIFVQKLDASGNFLWAKSFEGASDNIGNSITVDTSGNVYVTGIFEGTVDFDPGAGVTNLTAVGDYDIFVQKMDSLGNFLWAKSFGGPMYDNVVSITVDASGNAYTTGDFEGTLDFDPGAGVTNLTSVGGIDVFVQKMDASGNFLWAKSFGSSSYEYGLSITSDTSGNVYTTGIFEETVDFDPGAGTTNLTPVGDYDVFVQKMDASGDLLWAKSFGGALAVESYSSTIDVSGNVYTSGYFEGTVDFDPGTGTMNLTSVGSTDVFVQKMDASGNFLWAKSFGSTGSEYVQSITVDAIGNVYTTGNFEGTVDFDPGTGVTNLTSTGGFDVFVHKLSHCQSTVGIDVRTACDSLVWIDGNTYYASNNVATHTLQNSTGCDSVVTLDLTINTSSSSTDVRIACDSLVWIDGNTYYASNNVATHTLQNSIGCDSVVTLDLTINTPSSSTDVRTACDSLVWIDGNTYYASNNVATHTLQNSTGCDSVVTLDLTINSVSDLTTSVSGASITATNTNASYQWLDCDNNYAQLSGETNSIFIATSNGNYAVELNENGCVDTSNCVSIINVSIDELENSFSVMVYPNPTSEILTVVLEQSTHNVGLRMTDLQGRVVFQEQFDILQNTSIEMPETAGLYFLTILTDQGQSTIKLVRE
ncbi:MAG: SBBP repeat-containing protein [Saprospiraceae bacterium]|nr:SBBP repeat-containing protein [Saprospiraceae bacterium]